MSPLFLNKKIIAHKALAESKGLPIYTAQTGLLKYAPVKTAGEFQ